MTISTKILQDETERLQSKIELSEALYRLQNNKDFVSLFQMVYFTQYPMDAMDKLMDYPVGSPEYLAITRQLDQVSGLKHFLNKIQQDGAMAKDDLRTLQAIPLSEYDNE